MLHASKCIANHITGPNGSKKLVVQEIDLMSGKTDEAEFVTGGGGGVLPGSVASPNFRPAADDGSGSAAPSPQMMTPSINVHCASPSAAAAAVQSPAIPPLLTLDPVQQKAAYQMTHYLNGLMCMVSEHFTSLERYALHIFCPKKQMHTRNKAQVHTR